MQEINQILLNNAGQRLTTELINGMAHAIKIEFDKVQNELSAARQEISQLRDEIAQAVVKTERHDPFESKQPENI